jgi:multicomponent Na+:H+ antiporter subunit E
MGVPRASIAWQRGVAYFGFWLLLLPSFSLADLTFGLLLAGAATWVSMRLLPVDAESLRVSKLLQLVPHFIYESLLAGVDVARRALDPKLPLNPGLVNCPVGFPPGFARNTFATIMSLLPGSVSVGEGADDRVLVYHCLDLAQPLVEQLYAEERLFAKALVVGKAHV